jgi:hypothetical protein
MAGFESSQQEPTVSSAEVNPLGYQCDVHVGGHKLTIRGRGPSGPYSVVAGSTIGLPQYDELPPPVKRLVEKTFLELSEEHHQ